MWFVAGLRPILSYFSLVVYCNVISMEVTNSTHICMNRPASSVDGLTVSSRVFLVLSSASIVINTFTLSAFLCNRKLDHTVATRHLSAHLVVSDIVYVVALYITLGCI